ncbi:MULTISPECIES: RNA polymerase sigma factor [Nocardiopsis]|uniref:RNA polymerase sigma-70 region 2 domain-containing protein n=1 Tax=Nocardiopsis sinuspersici TaxID=501010 RepID=A0A1V3BW11_9ACTN|nr:MULTISPECIES: RNA polymerase sigma factor [Nocardiopsis]OOC52439.1 hypothetical protein NOSIN_00140 [Nocardiopsis sinuspersici]
MTHDEHNTDALSELSSRTGDESARAAFLWFIDDQYHQVIRFLIRYGATKDDALDATQEAFLEAWRQIHFPGQKIDNPHGWIRQVALNKYRRPPGPRKRPLTAPETPLPERPECHPGHAELTAQTLHVLQVIHRLERTDRAVIAFCMDGFTSVEAANYLGLTPQQARDALKRARRRLARELAPAALQEGGNP